MRASINMRRRGMCHAVPVAGLECEGSTMEVRWGPPGGRETRAKGRVSERPSTSNLFVSPVPALPRRRAVPPSSKLPCCFFVVALLLPLFPFLPCRAAEHSWCSYVTTSWAACRTRRPCQPCLDRDAPQASLAREPVFACREPCRCLGATNVCISKDPVVAIASSLLAPEHLELAVRTHARIIVTTQQALAETREAGIHVCRGLGSMPRLRPHRPGPIRLQAASGSQPAALRVASEGVTSPLY